MSSKNLPKNRCYTPLFGESGVIFFAILFYNWARKNSLISSMQSFLKPILEIHVTETLMKKCQGKRKVSLNLL
jgi:hypothetical protein